MNESIGFAIVGTGNAAARDAFARRQYCRAGESLSEIVGDPRRSGSQYLSDRRGGLSDRRNGRTRGDKVQRKLQPLVKDTQLAFHLVAPELSQLRLQFALFYGDSLEQELHGFLMETRTHGWNKFGFGW